MSNLVVDLPNSLNVALDREVARTKCCASTIVAAALGQYLGTPVHTIFQVRRRDQPQATLVGPWPEPGHALSRQSWRQTDAYILDLRVSPRDPALRRA